MSLSWDSFLENFIMKFFKYGEKLKDWNKTLRFNECHHLAYLLYLSTFMLFIYFFWLNHWHGILSFKTEAWLYPSTLLSIHCINFWAFDIETPTENLNLSNPPQIIVIYSRTIYNFALFSKYVNVLSFFHNSKNKKTKKKEVK